MGLVADDVPRTNVAPWPSGWAVIGAPPWHRSMRRALSLSLSLPLVSLLERHPSEQLETLARKALWWATARRVPSLFSSSLRIP